MLHWSLEGFFPFTCPSAHRTGRSATEQSFWLASFQWVAKGHISRMRCLSTHWAGAKVFRLKDDLPTHHNRNIFLHFPWEEYWCDKRTRKSQKVFQQIVTAIKCKVLSTYDMMQCLTLHVWANMNSCVVYESDVLSPQSVKYKHFVSFGASVLTPCTSHLSSFKELQSPY